MYSNNEKIIITNDDMLSGICRLRFIRKRKG